MIRFYKYLIYRLYTWRLQKKDDTPVGTIMYMMSVVHFFQLLFLYFVASTLFPTLRKIGPLTKVSGLIFVFGFALMFYLFIYNKEKWQRYVDEFKDETPEQRKKGTILVRLFTVGSIV
jgi:hypothetical protein